MFEILSGGIFGGLLGGIFRLAPEVLKYFDKKDERAHELAMFKNQCELEAQRGQQKLAEIGAQREAAVDMGGDGCLQRCNQSASRDGQSCGWLGG